MSRLLLFCILALCPIYRAEAAPPTTVVIGLGDISDITGQSQANPLRRFVKSLEQNPESPRFRLIWGDYMGNIQTNATALYDRRARTLRYYSDTAIGGMGNEEIAGEIKHWMLSGVTDAMLVKLERKHRGAPTSSDGTSYFSEMIYYGARRRDLGSRQVLSEFGKAMRDKRNARRQN